MSFDSIRSGRRLLWRGCAGLLLLVTPPGAEARKIEVYRVPKEEAPLPPPAAHSAHDGHHHHGMTPRAMPKISYTTPEGWTETGAGDMRAAGFTMVGTNGQSAHVAITPLPGMVGREALIVNMWRQQVGMPELADPEALAELTTVEIGAEPGKMFEIAGAAAGATTMRIITAMMHQGDQSWFFKLQGSDELVAAQKENFVAFLKSVKIEEAPALPAGHPPIASTARTTPSAAPSAAPVTARPDGPTWQVPATWQEVSGGQFLFTKFLLKDAKGQEASVNVSVSVGDGGGMAANLNRWLAQLGRTPWSEAELQQNTEEIDVMGGTATYVEMSGVDSSTERPATTLGAKVTRAGRTWYYKLMGDPELVAAEKQNFIQFVTGVRY